MRTLWIILGGLLLLAIFMLVARLTGSATPAALAAKCFIPLWLLVAAANMWVGVSQAGYSVAEEAPIFLVIFLVPAIAAALLWWRGPSAG
ncbi:hypothetical protein [Chitinimonas naiadis]